MRPACCQECAPRAYVLCWAVLCLHTHHAGRLIVDRDDNADRADAPERYGNEEDQYSREARRAYREQDLPRRLHDDRPYNQPGYEPEGGRPGGRENVDLDQNPGTFDGGQGERSGNQEDQHSSGPPATPYDQGEIGSWYGGDTGMGEPDSSLDHPPSDMENENADSGPQRQPRVVRAADAK
jgi:hypothetical protein